MEFKPGQHDSEGHALDTVNRSLGNRPCCFLTIWVRTSCSSCWNLEAAVCGYWPKESALQQNHFFRMAACSGDDSPSSEARTAEVTPRSSCNEPREMGHQSHSLHFLPAERGDVELQAENCGGSTTSLRAPQLGGVAQAIWRVRKSPVMTGGFHLGCSPCCSEAPISTYQVLCTSGSAGSCAPKCKSAFSRSRELGSSRGGKENVWGTQDHKECAQIAVP